MTRAGYCPIGGEPCQSLCDEPCTVNTELRALRADAAIGQLVRRKLVSLNGIPVDRCHITAKEVAVIDAGAKGK